jgi:hemoglobin
MPHAAFTDETLGDQIKRFYAVARQDPALGPIFDAVQDWPAHFEIMTDFWSSVMLTSGRYHRDALGAHRKHPITPEMFDRWLELWGQTADELFEPELAVQLRAKAERIGESLKLGLFFKLPPREARGV